MRGKVQRGRHTMPIKQRMTTMRWDTLTMKRVGTMAVRLCSMKLRWLRWKWRQNTNIMALRRLKATSLF